MIFCGFKTYTQTNSGPQCQILYAIPTTISKPMQLLEETLADVLRLEYPHGYFFRWVGKEEGISIFYKANLCAHDFIFQY